MYLDEAGDKICLFGAFSLFDRDFRQLLSLGDNLIQGFLEAPVSLKFWKIVCTGGNL
jgi:hypothetical protein